MKLFCKFFAACAATVALAACAAPAPELPEGKTMADVSFSPEGEMFVSGYCVTCCPDWCPGPAECCGNGGGGDGGGRPPIIHCTPMNPCVPMP